MQLKKGIKPINIILPSIDGNTFNLESLDGRPYLLSFLRFASCPFCNLRINQFVKRYNEFGKDFTIVAVYDSSIENLTRYTEGHNSPFPILADEENKYYKQYKIEHSFIGMLKGMILKMPTLLMGMFKGYLPLRIKGSITTMPADFLIDRDGVIQEAYYGKDADDHLPFETIKEFSLK